jgi:hypothetical protein
MAVMYPSGYGTTLVDIDNLFARHHVDKMHPEFARRLRAWIEAQNGDVGIGGSWRDDGSQPDKLGFAPEGKSFHQYQRFASGLVKFAAVDLVCRNPGGVHRSPRWDEVPVQGSQIAAKWGVHCNVSSEPWHMQCVEIDGWQSWINAGSPDPQAGYPIPTAPINIQLTSEMTMRLVDPPQRLLDTRQTRQPKDGETVYVQIPGSPKAAFINLTIVNPAKGGYASAFNPATGRPATSNVNFPPPGGAVCNTSWVACGGNGMIGVHVSAAAHVIVDLQAVAS